jgi:hypothetical protein
MSQIAVQGIQLGADRISQASKTLQPLLSNTHPLTGI